MGKRDWPTCSEEGCTSAAREVRGDYRGPRQPEADGKCARHRIEDTTYLPTPTPVPTLEEETEPEATLDESPVVVERIASLRDALRGDLLSSEVAALIRDQLLEGLRAAKTSFTTCPKCSHRHPVTLPDLSTRISATQRLVEEIEGKLAAQQQSAESAIDQEATKLLRDREALTDDELARYISRLERELADA
jgi:hypothetical protein